MSSVTTHDKVEPPRGAYVNWTPSPSHTTATARNVHPIPGPVK